MWDSQNVLQERDGALAKTAQYTDWPGFWGGLASQSRSGTSSFFGFDSQASTRVLVAIGGSITDSYSFKAFGEELAAGSGSVNPLRYVGVLGYFRDVGTSLYVRARMLVVLSARWLSRDPLGFRGGDPNSYRYSLGNPTSLQDPSGLDAASCPQVIFWIGDDAAYPEMLAEVLAAVDRINNAGRYHAWITGRTKQALASANVAPRLAGLYAAGHGGCGGVPFGCEWCYIKGIDWSYNVWGPSKRSPRCQGFYQKAPNDWKPLDVTSLPVFVRLSMNTCVGSRTAADVPAIERWIAHRIRVGVFKVTFCRQSEGGRCEASLVDRLNELHDFEKSFE